MDLEELKEKYYIAIISNASHDEITNLLKQAGLPARMFDAVACALEVQHGKPAPDEIFKVEKKDSVSEINSQNESNNNRIKTSFYHPNFQYLISIRVFGVEDAPVGQVYLSISIQVACRIFLRQIGGGRENNQSIENGSENYA